MSDYVQLWCNNLLSRSSYTVSQQFETWGECNKHVGPSYWYAKVNITLGPSPDLQVIDNMEKVKSDRLNQAGWFDQIVYGVLDVMLTDFSAPCKTFRLTILDVQIHDVDSNAIAFRLAGKDAARKIAAQLTSV
ncbi:MAG: hypothetical protein ACM3S0_17665 [Acidobacteriota bacterium]